MIKNCTKFVLVYIFISVFISENVSKFPNSIEMKKKGQNHQW